MAYIGARLGAVRRARGLTQEELAIKAGIARTDVNRIENDNLSVGPARLGRLADALEVSRLELQPEAEPDALGLTLRDRQEALEGDVRELVRLTQRLTRRVAALERRVRPASARGEGTAR